MIDNKITTILIDVDDTILDFKLCSKYAVGKAFNEYNLLFNDQVFETFSVENDKLWKLLEKGKITKDELFSTRWNIIFDILDIDEDGAVFEKTFVKYLEESSIEVEGAYQVLEYLASKYDVYAASNSRHNQQNKRLTKANMINFVKDIFVSDDIGYAKPTAEFFDGCFAHMGNVNKENVLMIGDSLTADIIGGINYGLNTCWFNKYFVPVPPNIKTNYVINNLLELKSIL